MLLGTKNSDRVLSLNWKSKMIRKVVRNAKEAETINLGMVVDLAKHAANQITQIIWGNKNSTEKMEVHAYIDNHATLDSIASTKQVERRLLRNDIEFLKQMLEDNDIQSYRWLQDERMLADIFTKEKNTKIGLEDVLERNKLECVVNNEDKVIFSGGEFKILGDMLRRKVIPKAKIPKRKKIRKIQEEEVQKKGGKVKKQK